MKSFSNYELTIGETVGILLLNKGTSAFTSNTLLILQQYHVVPFYMCWVGSDLVNTVYFLSFLGYSPQ